MIKYANILNDDAFKVVIFTPGNEELLAWMIGLMIPGKRIRKLEFQPTEQHGLAISDKISNFDAVCTSETGEMFLVEMQCTPQDNYADRMLSYASFPIRMQMARKMDAIHKGKARPMDYSLLPIYVISVVNFEIAHEQEGTLEHGLISRYGICSPKTGERMTEALNFVYMELGRVQVKLGEARACKTTLEQLAYSLKYMKELASCPEEFTDPMFHRLFAASEFANLDIDTQFKVSEIMRTELDRIAENNYARKQGLKQGLQQGLEKGLKQGEIQGKIELAGQLLKTGVDINTIVHASGLSKEAILAAQKDNLQSQGK